ncbi:MAG: complex I NDUFA9 subunit family protein [Paracoccaceae bacterium]
MTKLVTIYGGSGFVGRQIARLMAREGWRVRVACRHPNQAIFVKPYGAVGQVEPVFCNIRDDASVAAAMAGADAVINCVGTFDRGGKNAFDAVQHRGAARIAATATRLGVGALVHISAIGADATSPSAYQRSKAEGEAAVLAAYPAAVILRPSVMFGAGDGFFNRFAAQSRLGPILPITGASTLFQPVHVEDVALAAVKGALGQAAPGTYELGGPDVESFRNLMQRMLGVIRRRRMIVNLPFWMAGMLGGAFDIGSALTLGPISNRILTRDQVQSLRRDNVVSAGARGFAELGIAPVAMAAVLPDYLWRFRPSGQYEAIKASAKNLQKHG